MLTYKLLGTLLTYPSEGLQHHMDEVKSAIEGEGLLPAKVQRALFDFMDGYATRNLLRQQEDYVALFDRGRTHSLYLFEHVHGESRDRGQAMVDLTDHYKAHGFTLTASELPDYLPLFLEFLSQLEMADAQALLDEIVHIVGAVGGKLKAKKSGYHQVFRAIEALAAVKVDKKFVAQAVADAEAEDNSLEALDKEWEEAPAFDGAGDASCAVCPEATRHPQSGPTAAATQH